jgi:ubiquitin C-terminal hydrolase
MFQLCNRHQAICSSCGHSEAVNYVNETGIQLQITSSDRVKLEDLLDETFREKPDGEPALCAGCKEHHPKPKTVHILGAPEVLFIMLNATEDPNGEDTVRRKVVPLNVEYSLWLDLSKYQPETNKEEPRDSVSQQFQHSLPTRR